MVDVLRWMTSALGSWRGGSLLPRKSPDLSQRSGRKPSQRPRPKPKEKPRGGAPSLLWGWLLIPVVANSHPERRGLGYLWGPYLDCRAAERPNIDVASMLHGVVVAASTAASKATLPASRVPSLEARLRAASAADTVEQRGSPGLSNALRACSAILVRGSAPNPGLNRGGGARKHHTKIDVSQNRPPQVPQVRRSQLRRHVVLLLVKSSLSGRYSAFSEGLRRGRLSSSSHNGDYRASRCMAKATSV